MCNYCIFKYLFHSSAENINLENRRKDPEKAQESQQTYFQKYFIFPR